MGVQVPITRRQWLEVASYVLSLAIHPRRMWLLLLPNLCFPIHSCVSSIVVEASMRSEYPLFVSYSYSQLWTHLHLPIVVAVVDVVKGIGHY